MALLHKDGIKWSPEAAFGALQRALTTTPILQLLDSTREFVECDASGFGLDAMLYQGGWPVAFFIRLLAPRHMNLRAYEELTGLVQEIRHWHPYLWGHPFLIKTDHYSRKFLLDQRLSTILQHQWASKLIGFDFRVEYRPASTNVSHGATQKRLLQLWLYRHRHSSSSMIFFKN
jgi:hypothetical protein